MKIGSAAGVAGDVVGVTLAMQPKPGMAIIGYPLLDVVVCHDPRVAELARLPDGTLRQPDYTDEFWPLISKVVGSPLISFLEVNEDRGAPGTQTGHGFILEVFFDPEVFSTRFPAPYTAPLEWLPIMTVYYKLKGEPGESAPLEFCDYSLMRYNLRCNYNHIYSDEELVGNQVIAFDYLPETTSGTLFMKPRPAAPARPGVPGYPPKAKVYPQPPTPEEAGFQVTLRNCSHVPGGLAAVDVFVRSDVEYSGIMLPIGFDDQQLDFAWAQHFYVGGLDSTTFPGANPTHSCVYIYSGLKGGCQRLAPPEENYPAATLYFTVRENIKTRLPRDEPADWRITVHHEGDPEEILIPPVSVKAVDFPNPASVPRGDVYVDGRVDITDAILLLDILFRGGLEAPCPAATDYNQDGQVDISDPVAILNCLFLGICDEGLAPEVPCW